MSVMVTVGGLLSLKHCLSFWVYYSKHWLTRELMTDVKMFKLMSRNLLEVFCWSKFGLLKTTNKPI